MNEPEPTPAEYREDTRPPEATATEPEMLAGPVAPAPRKRRRIVMPLIYLACLAVLVLAGLWIWQNPDFLSGGGTSSSTSAGAAPGNTPGNTPATGIAQLQQQVQDLAARVARLEAAPGPSGNAATVPPAAPSIAAFDTLQKRLTALEQRPAPSPAPPPPAPGVSPDEVAALRNQVSTDNQKLSLLDQTVAALAGRVQGGDSQTTAQLQALQGRVDSSDKLNSQVSGQISSLAARATRLTQVQAASAALAAGKPLGSIADAPPALARFATATPPTEAGLRLAYPTLADQALAAAQPDSGAKPFLDRVWGRMQQAITVRAGDRVIVGNPAAALLARAQDALDAGDLAGAMAALKKLPPDAAAPLAGWMDQASALLAARGALADMAGRA